MQFNTCQKYNSQTNFTHGHYHSCHYRLAVDKQNTPIITHLVIMISAVTPAVQRRTKYSEYEQDNNMKAPYKFRGERSIKNEETLLETDKKSTC